MTSETSGFHRTPKVYVYDLNCKMRYKGRFCRTKTTDTNGPIDVEGRDLKYFSDADFAFAGPPEYFRNSSETRDALQAQLKEKFGSGAKVGKVPSADSVFNARNGEWTKHVL